MIRYIICLYMIIYMIMSYECVCVCVFIISPLSSRISPPRPGSSHKFSDTPAVSTSSAVLTGGKRARRSISSLQSLRASAVLREKRSRSPLGGCGRSGTLVKLGSNLKLLWKKVNGDGSI